MDEFSNRFIEYLKKGDIKGLRNVPKSDLHNHCVLGGDREYIRRKTGILVPALDGRLCSIREMHGWYNRHIGSRFDSYEMRKVLIEAAFYQAERDGIKVLETGEDVWANDEYYDGDVGLLIDTFQSIKEAIAPSNCVCR